MCRLAAWIGAPTALANVILSPSHSLLTQSQGATEAKFAVNGDGFGIAWYSADDPRPGLYRDVMPAWSDGNLPSLCRMIVSPLFLAHVRASTGAETSRLNCHPFTHGRWSFMHNGQLGAFARIRRTLEQSLPDTIYNLKRGSTDSELLFLMLLAEGLDVDPQRAVTRVLERLAALRNPDDKPDRITFVLSDGARLMVLRHASDNRCPTLYYRTGPQGTIVASEPLDGDASTWTAFKRDALIDVAAQAEGIAQPTCA